MPRVASVHLYPVKSLHRVSTPFLQLDPWGAQGDRRWLVAAPDGTFLTQRSVPKMATIHVSPEDDGIILSTPDAPDLHVPFPGKDAAERRVRLWTPDEVPARDAGEKAAAWLTQVLETTCGLVFMDRPENARPSGFGPVSFADEFPLLITTAESLADLNTRLETPVPMERFRPNVVVEGVDAWSEDGWTRLRIGETVLAIPKPCARCGVTMVDQENGTIPVPKEPLQTLAKFRHQPAGVIFGQNATVETAGRIAPGDEVEILERSD